MSERSGIVTAGGNPVTLVGNEVKVGDRAPDFTAIGNDMTPVAFSSFGSKIRVITAVPSLDTDVCSTEVARFNMEAGKLGDGVAIVTVSMDLPFAQARWCGAHGATNVTTVSDHRDAAFGSAYGVLIKETRLLARSVFVIDGEGVVRYIQIVPELSHEPDYDEVLKAIEDVR